MKSGVFLLCGALTKTAALKLPLFNCFHLSCKESELQLPLFFDWLWLLESARPALRANISERSADE